MKKLIAMILALALCLGGCADTAQSQASEEPTTTTELTSAAPETTQESETTEEITTEAEEPTGLPPMEEETATVTERLMHLLVQYNAPTGDVLVKAQEYLETFERAMYLMMRNEFDDYGYVNEQWNYLGECTELKKLFFAWQLAENDPSVTVTRGGGMKASIARAEFDEYHFNLFGEEMILGNYEYSSSIGTLAINDNEVSMTYYGGLQDAMPILKVPQFDAQSGQLRMQMLLHTETQVENGRKYTLFLGDFTSCEDPSICEYPEEYRFATIVFGLEDTGDGYYITSLEFEDINENAQTVFSESNPYMHKSFYELLDSMPYGVEPDENLRCAMQMILLYSYHDAINALLEPFDKKIKVDYDYLQASEDKAVFAWFRMLRTSDSVLWDATPDGGSATGAAAVTVEDYMRYYRELFSEDVEIESLDGMAIYYAYTFTVQDGFLYGSFPTGYGSAEAIMKNPILSYEEASQEYILSMDLLAKQTECESNGSVYYVIEGQEYLDYDITEYPQELVSGTIAFRMTKNESGYQLNSIVITD